MRTGNTAESMPQARGESGRIASGVRAPATVSTKPYSRMTSFSSYVRQILSDRAREIQVINKTLLCSQSEVCYSLVRLWVRGQSQHNSSIEHLRRCLRQYKAGYYQPAAPYEPESSIRLLWLQRWVVPQRRGELHTMPGHCSGVSDAR